MVPGSFSWLFYVHSVTFADQYHAKLRITAVEKMCRGQYREKRDTVKDLVVL